MNAEHFVSVIKNVVVESTIKSVGLNLAQPAGKKPEPGLVDLSNWFNRLQQVDRDFVLNVVRRSVEGAVFGFFCVLDGVRAIEDEDKGELKLFYTKGKESVLLNDINDALLHNML